MAYALNFPAEITSLIYSMRDWKFEEVKKKGGTPSRLALTPFRIFNRRAKEIGITELASPSAYFIQVTNRIIHPDIWIHGLIDNTWGRWAEHEWADNILKGNDNFEHLHGSHIYPCSKILRRTIDGDSDED